MRSGMTKFQGKARLDLEGFKPVFHLLQQKFSRSAMSSGVSSSSRGSQECSSQQGSFPCELTSASSTLASFDFGSISSTRSSVAEAPSRSFAESCSWKTAKFSCRLPGSANGKSIKFAGLLRDEWWRGHRGNLLARGNRRTLLSSKGSITVPVSASEPLGNSRLACSIRSRSEKPDQQRHWGQTSGHRRKFSDTCHLPLCRSGRRCNIVCIKTTVTFGGYAQM